jgi:YggT family protein
MFVPPPLPIPIVSILVRYGIGFIILAMFVRAIASWFRFDERYAIIRFLARITDPFITPLRRIIRPVGVIDLSFFIAWFMLSTLQFLLLQALPQGW